MNQNDKIKEYQKQIEELTKENPELAIFQKELQKLYNQILDNNKLLCQPIKKLRGQ